MSSPDRVTVSRVTPIDAVLDVAKGGESHVCEVNGKRYSNTPLLVNNMRVWPVTGTVIKGYGEELHSNTKMGKIGAKGGFVTVGIPTHIVTGMLKKTALYSGTEVDFSDSARFSPVESQINGVDYMAATLGLPKVGDPECVVTVNSDNGMVEQSEYAMREVISRGKSIDGVGLFVLDLMQCTDESGVQHPEYLRLQIQQKFFLQDTVEVAWPNAGSCAPEPMPNLDLESVGTATRLFASLSLSMVH